LQRPVRRRNLRRLMPAVSSEQYSAGTARSSLAGRTGSERRFKRVVAHPAVENPNPPCCSVSDDRRFVCGVGKIASESLQVMVLIFASCCKFDVNPSSNLSKTSTGKLIHFCARSVRIEYPSPIHLDLRVLPCPSNADR